MINVIRVTNYLGESIDLDLKNPEESGFAVYAMDGIGPDEASINIKDVATYDGGKYNSARFKKRDINLTLRFVGTDIESVRQKSYKYFPTKHLLRLTFYTDNRTTYVEGYVEENEATIFATKNNKAGCKISIVCADPYFYSLYDNTVVFSGVMPMFEFPFDNNSTSKDLIEIGSIVTKQYETVYYEGDADNGVIITIHTLGTVGDLSIHNVSKRQSITLYQSKLETMTGSGLTESDTVTINTNRGHKGITLLRDGNEINILNCLGKSIDWFTISKGDNIFAYVASEGASNVQFKVVSKNIHEGV